MSGGSGTGPRSGAGFRAGAGGGAKAGAGADGPPAKGRATSGLARAALRGHRASFTGTALAALFAATVVSASTMLLAATGAEDVPPAARRAMAASEVGIMAAGFLIVSVYLSVFVIASTMGTAVTQQHREFAMLRAIGARPWQIRRAVAAQAVAAAVPSAVAGFALGGVLARWWFGGMADHGLIPPGVAFTFSWVALPVCLAVATVTSALAGVLAASRFAGLRPARALEEAAAGRRELGLLRLPLGLAAVAGGVVVSSVLAGRPEKAGQGSFLVLLLFCFGVGLLGPRIVGPVAWLVARSAGRLGSAAELAMLNVTTQSRRFSAAVVPLVLVVAFGTTKIAMHTTALHRTGSAGPAPSVWMDYAVTGLYAGFAAIAAANTLAMITTERRRDLALLRLIGTHPLRLRSMAAWESAVVAATALLLGTAIALCTLAPLLRSAYGSALPYLPWTTALGISGGVLLLTLLATGLPVHATLRRRATETLAAA
ncbi:ABC transporter permease [Streptomyces rimosus]|uniref:ABC transporter permease n=1 Tax=Streptomyces rimosus TaxID=1927 RepID=UPI0004BF0D04|nr:ABC transporter permease [Streptomyces rimosus]